MPTYRKILKTAFRFTLRHKTLWFVGFFTALLGNGGEYEILLKNTKTALQADMSLFELPKFFMQSFISDNFINQLYSFVRFQNPLIPLGVLIVLTLLVYLVITSQGVLIKSIYQSTKLKRRPKIKKMWLEIRSKFWELFIAILLFKGVGFVITLLISLPIIILLHSITPLSITYSTLIVGFLIFTPLAIFVSFIVKYMLIFIVIKNYNFTESLKASIKLFKENWLITMENAILLFVINFLFGFAVLIGAIVLSYPIIALIAVVVYPKALPDGYYITIIAWLSIILLPIFGSALAVFQMSTWTILWNKLIGERKIQSKIVRIAARLVGR